MTTLNISLPDNLRAAANERVARGEYPSLSEYLADLIRRDVELERLEQERIEAILLERLDGPSQEVTDADFDRIRQRLEAEIASRKQP